VTYLGTKWSCFASSYFYRIASSVLAGLTVEFGSRKISHI